MPARTTVSPKPGQWVVNEKGQPVAVLIAIEEYRAMQERLGEIATREEESSPEAMRLLLEAEADIAAGRLVPHAAVARSARQPRRRRGNG